jgi:hypothetical protein
MRSVSGLRGEHQLVSDLAVTKLRQTEGINVMFSFNGTTATGTDSDSTSARPPNTGKRRPLRRPDIGIALAAAGSGPVDALPSGVTAASASTLGARS